jgi:hypothetical protein
MIDGIKTGNIPVPDHSVLEWIGNVNETTAELLPNKVARLNGLTFTKKHDKIFCRGSLHRFFNNGVHNHNDLSLENVYLAIRRLCEALNVTPSDIVLEGLEFGVNIKMDQKPRNYIVSAIMRKNTPFVSFSDHVTKGKSASGVCKYTNFSIKIYDKGLQYNRPGNLLRIEIAVNKMRYFKERGVDLHTLADIDETNIYKLQNLLRQTIDEVLFCDPIPDDTARFSQKDLNALLKGNNLNNWLHAMPVSDNYPQKHNDPGYKCARTKYNRQMMRFKTLVEKYGLTSYKDEIISKITEKCIQLHRTRNEQSVYNLTDKNDQDEKEFCIQPHTEHIQLNCTTCPVTGLNISMQKDYSRFLCTSGIKYYMKNDINVWQELYQRLSPKWQNAPLEKQIEEIHHSIRNEYNNTKRSIEKILKYPSLFDPRPYIRQDKRALIGFD